VGPNVLVCGGPAPTFEPARCWRPVRSTYRLGVPSRLRMGAFDTGMLEC
jgi:hypothetical protein